MSRTALMAGITLALALAAAGLAQAPTATLASGTKINSELKSKLDTRHAQVGERVTAVTTSDVSEHGVKVLPTGSTLIGHVTEVTRARNSQSPSSIGVLFYQAVTKRGARYPLHAAIVSVISGSASAPLPVSAPMAPMPMSPPPMAATGGGLLGGAGAAVSGVTGLGAAATPALVQGGAAAGIRAVASNGVPFQIALPSAGASASQRSRLGSVLSTPRGNLEFDSGTRLQLRQTGLSAAGSGSVSAGGSARPE